MRINSGHIKMTINKRKNIFFVMAFAMVVVIILGVTSYLLINQSRAKIVFDGPDSLDIKQISAGSHHICVIASDDQAYCWGNNENGRLGNGSTANSRVPVAVSTDGLLADKTIKQISAGYYHTCVIASDDQVYCWGNNQYGQLGNSSTTNSSVPVAVDTTGVLAGKTIKQITSGGNHTCAIASDDQAYCWGGNGNGQLGNNTYTIFNVPVAVSTTGVLAGKTIKQIAPGANHTCVVASDDQAYCWGYNGHGQLGNNSTTRSRIPVAVSTSGVLSGKTIKQITSGGNHNCAVASDNKPYCWGASDQLGNSATADSLVPVAVNTSGVLSGKTIKQISTGYNHTCTIASDDQAYCWGGDYYGQLGNNTIVSKSDPVAVSTSGVLSGKNISQISTGTNYTCAIASDNQTYCWGYNGHGQLGNNSTTNSSVPVAVNPLLISHQVLTDQSVYRVYRSSSTAGPGSPLAETNTQGALPGVGDSFRVRVGVENEKGVATIKQIAAGGSHVCAIASDNQAYCWGANGNGQLGNNSNTSSRIPVAVDTSGVLAGKTIKQIAAGYVYTCVIASDDQVYCWGQGGYGQLGNNSTASSSIPVAVDTSGVLAGKTIKSISAGYYHACAIASDDQAYCWGAGGNGRLGNSSTVDSSIPVAVTTSGVLAGKTIKQISSIGYHTCVLASDNQVYCWGQDGYGQLGDGTNTTSSIPVAVSTAGVLSGKTIKQVSTGGNHTCVLASDNQVYCWGYGSNGRLGNDSTTNFNVPVAVSTTGVLAGKTIKQVSANNSHTCVIASDNQTYCWGWNQYGQLGDGSTTESHIPVAVSTSGVLAGKTIKQIAAGYYHTCVIASDSYAYCWGSNGGFQLGDNATGNSNIPVATNPITIDTDIPAGLMKLRAQYAPKSGVTTCSAVASNTWQNITATSALAYSSSGPAHGTVISSSSNDPALPASSTSFGYQSIVRPTSDSQLTFTNRTAINSGQTGLWDLALVDRSLNSSADYCIRLVVDDSADPNSNIDAYTNYPEIKTASGALGLRFTNASNATLTNPTTAFTGTSVNRNVSTTTASLTNTSSRQLEVSNSLSSTGWSVVLSATGGVNAKWQSDSNNYSFNAATSANGRLNVDLSSSNFITEGTGIDGQACSTAGLSFGASSAFVSGTSTANSVTLATASSSSVMRCAFKLQNIKLSQTVPAYQAAGTYTLPMTLTVTAQ